MAGGNKKKNADLPELKRQIRENSLKPLYLFYGNEVYLKDAYINEIKKAVPDNGFEDFNRIVLKGTDISFEEYDEAWDSFPMMADRRLIIISGSGIFGRVKEEQKDFWKERLSRCSEDTVVIFNEESVDKRGVIYKAFAKNGMAVEFETPDMPELVTFITGQCLRAKRKIRREHARLIAERCGDDLQSIVNELNKLFDYCGEEITKSDVEAVVSKSLNVRVFDLTDAIMDRDAKKAAELLSELQNDGDRAFSVMYLILSNVTKLLKTKLSGSTNSTEVSRLIGVKEFIARKYISSAAKFSEEALAEMAARIPEIDYEIKLGKTDEWTALEQYAAEAIYYS